MIKKAFFALITILIASFGYHRYFFSLIPEQLPTELRQKDSDTELPKPTFEPPTPQRGYLVNNRQQAIKVLTIDYADRPLNVYFLYPGQNQRITRLYNTFKAISVNGTILESCIVPGAEFEVPLQKRSGETILNKDDKDFFPYLECVDQTPME